VPSDLIARIRDIWVGARTQAARSVNTAHVCANWMIGQQIVEAEQGGARRAGYGLALLEALASRLGGEFGEGFSLTALKHMRGFYLAYPDLLEKGHTPCDLSVEAGRKQLPQFEFLARGERDWMPGRLHSGLSWSHYRALLKVGHRAARDFYEVEALRGSWSARQLQRQIHSMLFERLLKSRDKKGALQLSSEGLRAEQPQDAIKDPYVLEFLDLPQSNRLVETQLEEALIQKLQDFLLELGSGFALVGRQMRLTLDGDHFYPDLVFFHVKLRCYVVIDLKVSKLTHGDLGQMQMYVNYFDHEVASSNDQPTIGLVMCADKNDAMVRYVLDDKSKRIFASRYKLELPSEDELRAELRRELGTMERPKSGGKLSVSASSPAAASRPRRRGFRPR
jgi:predicted nuclease of restriction endonuclease-like (RecB) superfamily